MTGLWTHLTAYWSSLTTSDILTTIYVIFLILIAILSNHLFIAFINSKPEGRKTVLGKKRKFSINLICLFS